MKKSLLVLIAMFLMLSGCSSSPASSSSVTEESSEETVIEVEPEPEPLYYSDPIYLYATKDSGIKSVEDLSGKRLALQVHYDADSSAYVKEQLEEAGITGIEYVESTYYTQLPELINAEEDAIDAWVISKGENELIHDYRQDYVLEDYVVVAEYAIPYYEEKTIDQYILDNPLYTEPFAVMITGIDERVSPDANKAARNDVDILMIVNPELKHISTFSFPRDSYFTNACTGYKDKLTHFGMSGTECIKKSIGNLLDIEIPYFVQVSFSTFIDMINSIGGVYVDVPLDFRMDQDSYRNVKQPYSLTAGYQQILGEWALALARNRKYSNLAGGDYGRIRNQCLIVNGIIEKIAEYPFLPGWAGWDWQGFAYTNLESEDIYTLFALAETFHDGYTVDNYFMVNNGSMTESGMSIGLIPESSRKIAELKAKLTLTGEIDPTEYYYEDVMTGYVTGGASTSNIGYVGEEYDLRDVFVEYKETVEEVTEESTETEETSEEKKG